MLGEGLVDKFPAGIGKGHDSPAAVAGATAAGDQTVSFKAVDAFGHRPRGDHGERGEFARSPFERLTRAAEGGKHVEIALTEPVAPVGDEELLGQVAGEAVQPPDDALRADVHVRPFPQPRLLNAGDMIGVLTHEGIIASMEAIMPSMEATFRWALITAIAPVAWGSTYFVTEQLLPAGYPLYGAIIRALPAGLLLLLLRRKRPHGSWWWKSAVLGTLNMSVFFALVYLAAQTLPTSIASTIMATSPLVMMLLAWLALSERPRPTHLAGAGIGLAGVCLMLLDGTSPTSLPGVLASVAAMTMSSLGYVLAKKWSANIDVFSLTSWQLLAGGILLLPAAIAIEGPPPPLPAPAVLGFGYVTLAATAIAFAAWFTGLRHLNAAVVGLIGLLNPVTGVLLGTIVAGERLALHQICGLVLVFLGIVLGQPVATRLAVLVRGKNAAADSPTCRPVPGAAGHRRLHRSCPGPEIEPARSFRPDGARTA